MYKAAGRRDRSLPGMRPTAHWHLEWVKPTKEQGTPRPVYSHKHPWQRNPWPGQPSGQAHTALGEVPPTPPQLPAHRPESCHCEPRHSTKHLPLLHKTAGPERQSRAGAGGHDQDLSHGSPPLRDLSQCPSRAQGSRLLRDVVHEQRAVRSSGPACTQSRTWVKNPGQVCAAFATFLEIQKSIKTKLPQDSKMLETARTGAD